MKPYPIQLYRAPEGKLKAAISRTRRNTQSEKAYRAESDSDSKSQQMGKFSNANSDSGEMSTYWESEVSMRICHNGPNVDPANASSRTVIQRISKQFLTFNRSQPNLKSKSPVLLLYNSVEKSRFRKLGFRSRKESKEISMTSYKLQKRLYLRRKLSSHLLPICPSKS